MNPHPQWNKTKKNETKFWFWWKHDDVDVRVYSVCVWWDGKPHPFGNIQPIFLFSFFFTLHTIIIVNLQHHYHDQQCHGIFWWLVGWLTFKHHHYHQHLKKNVVKKKVKKTHPITYEWLWKTNLVMMKKKITLTIRKFIYNFYLSIQFTFFCFSVEKTSKKCQQSKHTSTMCVCWFLCWQKFLI